MVSKATAAVHAPLRPAFVRGSGSQHRTWTLEAVLSDLVEGQDGFQCFEGFSKALEEVVLVGNSFEAASFGCRGPFSEAYRQRDELRVVSSGPGRAVDGGVWPASLVFKGRQWLEAAVSQPCSMEPPPGAFRLDSDDVPFTRFM